MLLCQCAYAQHYRKGDLSIGVGMCSFIINNLGGFVTVDYDVKDFGGSDNGRFSLLLGGGVAITCGREFHKTIDILPDAHMYVNWNTRIEGFNVYSGLGAKALLKYNYGGRTPENENVKSLDIFGLLPSIPLGFKYFFNDKAGIFADFSIPDISNRLGFVYKF